MLNVSAGELQKLIQTSSLLNDSEKQEWLSTMEFMNDKQIQDLYDILGGSEAPVPAPVSTPVKPSIAPESQPTQGAPLEAFLHKATVQSFIPKTPIAVTPIKPTLAKPGAPKPPSTWREKLDKEVKEKELPAPPKEELLSDHVIPDTSLSGQSPAIANSHEPESRTRNLDAGSESGMAQVVKPTESSKNDTISMSALLDVTAPAIPAVSFNKPSAPKKNAEELLTEAEEFSTPDSATVTTLADVSNVGVGLLRSIGVSDLTQKLRNIVVQEGYFAVLFNFEKSPLYKSYVETGRKILTEHVKFNELKGDNYLNKDEFEAMTDLLQEIRG